MPYSENNMAPYRNSPETRAAIRRDKRKRLLKKALSKRVAPETRQKGGFQYAINKKVSTPAQGKHPFY